MSPEVNFVIPGDEETVDRANIYGDFAPMKCN